MKNVTEFVKFLLDLFGVFCFGLHTILKEEITTPMYQMSMSISADYSEWLYAAEKSLRHKLGDNAVIVTRSEIKRHYIAIACENNHKKRVASAVFDALVDVYATKAKLHYYKENLILPLPLQKYNILLAALVEFDSASDREIISTTLTLENGLNLDGVYNFLFNDVKERWNDIGQLTKENAVYLNDNEIFFELIKYLFSAISPKTEVVTLLFDGNKYTLLGVRGEVLKEVYTEEELLCSLITLAPVCLDLVGGYFDVSTRQKLNVIFGNDKRKKSTAIK